MNKDNNIYYLVLLITFFLNSLFNITNAFNPFGGDGQNMDQAMEDLLKEIQNLSPEDQQLLNDLSRQMEEEMASKGLDPSNPDDIFKWAEENEKPELKNPEVPIIEKTNEKKPIEIEKTQLINTPENALKILSGISEHLALTREKSIFYPELSQKLEYWSDELDQLSYLVNILDQKDLIQHLISKQFEPLYKNLENLYIVLNKYEPEIKIIKTDEETPYDILGIPYYSSQQQIEEKYKEFQEKYSDSYITNLGKEKKIPERELKKKLKEAHLALNFIEDAYLKLKDPKDRKQIDRLLSQQIQDDKVSYRISENAFNNIVKNINRSVFDDKLITEIKKLLEKYKPEELAKAQAQEKIDKQVLERSKQPIKINPSPNKSPQEKSGYEQFNKLMAQEKNKNIPYPTRPPANNPAEKKSSSNQASLTEDSNKMKADKEKKGQDIEDKEKKDKELSLVPIKEELKHINDRLNQIAPLTGNSSKQPIPSQVPTQVPEIGSSENNSAEQTEIIQAPSTSIRSSERSSSIPGQISEGNSSENNAGMISNRTKNRLNRGNPNRKNTRNITKNKRFRNLK